MSTLLTLDKTGRCDAVRCVATGLREEEEEEKMMVSKKNAFSVIRTALSMETS